MENDGIKFDGVMELGLLNELAFCVKLMLKLMFHLICTCAFCEQARLETESELETFFCHAQDLFILLVYGPLFSLHFFLVVLFLLITLLVLTSKERNKKSAFPKNGSASFTLICTSNRGFLFLPSFDC